MTAPKSEMPTLNDVAHLIDRGGADGCWLWLGFINPDGYGRVTFRRRQVGYKQMLRAHRFVYERLVGGVRDDMVLHHKCGVRACVNPDHLEPLTRAAHGSEHGPDWRSPTCRHCGEADWWLAQCGDRRCRECRRRKARMAAGVPCTESMP